MPKLELNGNVWYGFDKDSKPVAITHSALMYWAGQRGQSEEINSSTVVVLPDKTRLVRGENMLQLAESHGWQDIATSLGDEIAKNLTA